VRIWASVIVVSALAVACSGYTIRAHHDGDDGHEPDAGGAGRSDASGGSSSGDGDASAAGSGNGGASGSGGTASGKGGADASASSGGVTTDVDGGSAAGGRPDRGAGGTPADRPKLGDFTDVTRPQDFDAPVSLPPPRTSITGALDDLVGTWIEVNADGTDCTPDDSSHIVSGIACTRLEVQKTPSGGHSAVISWQASTQVVSNPPIVSGPFAPLGDPGVGYPTGVSPSSYTVLRQQFAANVGYRVLEGSVSGSHMTFWASPNEIWTDWCAAQTVFPWNVDGRTAYRCVPQQATADDTDLGRLALCTTTADMPTCTAAGLPVACVCLTDGQVDFSNPLCSPAACECTKTECSAAVRSSASSFQFERQGDRLVGDSSLGAITLRKIDAAPGAGTDDPPDAVVPSGGTKAIESQSTVWIGEVERPVTFPEISALAGTERVVLILDRATDRITGSITFGTDPVPPQVTSPNPDTSPGFYSAAYSGFSYSLVGSELHGNTLDLAFSPTEINDSWCATQHDNTRDDGNLCDCAGGFCYARTGPLVHVDMIVAETSMDGRYPFAPNSIFDAPGIRLDRVQ
jgi:hypothetical protein